MIIRQLEERRASAFHIERPNWTSTRLVAASDELGFSMHLTTIFAGPVGETEYPDHLEAAYCLSGSATLIFEDGRRTETIEPGVLYALDKHDRHSMEVHDDLVLVCVFNPALQGGENASAKGE